ncbi:homeobox protein CDX-1-like [Podarcis lilfordi]|uniref:Homeobox protein CDX-1-like n=1 Tax=Podarcis lilfordi TaxID=74358 RepID=A0AA35PR39_9SAUR|nr:homeobox protein CDX-1-like [Podarcis lilfordi]
MYPGSVRCNSSSSSNNNNLPAQNFASTTPYADYMGYHPMQNMDHRGQPSGAWGAHYGLQREDWNAYGPAPSNTVTATQMNGSSPGQVSYSSADYNSLNPAGSGALPSVNTINTEQISPHSQRHSSYEWMRKTVQSTSTGFTFAPFLEGFRSHRHRLIHVTKRMLMIWYPICLMILSKTRTREKYRVVYTDHQRLELEKEFHYNRYITIRRKSELAANLRLSERQVKIWFQNRRAKERKLMKKKMTSFDGSSLSSIQSDSGSMSPIPMPDPQTHSEMAGTLFPPPPPPAPLPMNGLQHNGNLQQVVASQ